MSSAPDHAAELALLWCVALNAAVFGSAWRFASRRLTAVRSQAVLDAALLGYAVQYAAVGLPGMAGLLRPAVVVGVALALSALLALTAGRRRPTPTDDVGRPAAVALLAFAAAAVVGFAYLQSDVPLLANDPLTYHFPAAVQWLQTGRVGPFPTWFFNPANGYSPLAGSTFVAWLMVPFASDLLARFVQVPALLCVGLGMYRLARQLTAARPAAAAVASAAVLCRPLFTAALMGKDDLFVAFAFVAAVVALAPDRSAERFGAVRLGLAVGLLLATKYTALLAVPLLLLAVGRRRPRWWATAAAVAVCMAGPWYARNGVATGNPVFPLDVSVAGLHLRGLFTMARSDGLSSWYDDAAVVLARNYGVPAAVAVVAVVGWVLAARRPWADPLRRACVLGPPLGLALFCWRSPFPEVRFLFPAILLGLATAATNPWTPFALLAAATATVSVWSGWPVIVPLLAVSAVLAVAVAACDRTVRRPARRWAAAAVPVVAVAAVAYVQWTAYARDYVAQWSEDGSAWSVYPDWPLWQFVNHTVPADATVAYADLYLVYPLQGPQLRRRLAYAPTRRGVRTPADLPWLGGHLSGERLVTLTDKATVADPDGAMWRANLQGLGAQYLVIGHAAAGPEAAWAAADPAHFRPLFAGPAGWVYAVD